MPKIVLLMKGGVTLKLESRDQVLEEALPENAFNKYADTVYKLAFIRTKSKSDADDILQDVFLRYIKIYEKMQNEEHIKATLLRITINCSNSFFTAWYRKKTEPLNENIAEYDENNDGYVLQQVLNLPLKYRTVIHMYYYLGYSVEEIAKLNDSNPSTVKTHLHRAREILKNTIKADDL